MMSWQPEFTDKTLSRKTGAVHSERIGVCSAEYQALLKRHNLCGSMSTKGCCYDNACVEIFFFL
ncbi:hypothetical protein GJ11_p01960 (plasmid) [Escherichia coli]|nr:hypothetical protein GJ11_p01960 [Escherichia coli]